MIFGIGTDIVEIPRIESMWARHGVRLADRLLSNDEMAGCRASRNAARFIAKRFAAKEALAKAVGTGLRVPVSLRRISVVHDALGKPMFQFDDLLRQHLVGLGVVGHHLSLSDDRDLIVAFVVLERD
jgi:holo-[acyl-carrier protein] synthase